MKSPRAKWYGLIVISLAVSLIIVDSTIVNVAIPSIVDDLGISSTQVQWVQESYTLVFAALLLMFGTIADRIGRRRLLVIGVTIFGASSVLAALAWTGDLLIGFRVLQGVGGAMILPSTLSIINATFRGRDRAIAFAVWGSTIGGMAAVGPVLGGWLTTYFSWRWAFGINVPFGIVIIIGLYLWALESREKGTQRIDLVGAALSVIASGALVFGLIEGRTYGWWLADTVPDIGSWTWPFDLSPIPVVFLIALLGLIGFIAWGVHRERAGKSTMLAFGLFSIASFRNGNIAAMIVSLGEYGIILSLPLWLQNVLGYDALQTGYVILALAIGSFVASGFAGSFGNRISPVWIVRMGILAEIVGIVIVGLVISSDTRWWLIAIGLFVYGFGIGLATAQLTGVVLKDVPVEQSGQGSGTQSTSRQIGSALGIAVLGTILFSSVGTSLEARLAENPVPESVKSQIVDAVVDSAGNAIPGLEKRDATIYAAARDAFSDGTRFSAFAAAGFLAFGLLATLRLDSRRPESAEPSASSELAASAAPPAP
ncbi:EmrB/QacA subfamily drug resistance transporter [Cryobacterium mesophilum]|uniref:DHA2 family efflux MFS transporter permease subunit n=1 Tax=Terrimesophilobacter mesophilus TaxID=433647 RepID=A0A4R8VAR3_9MICO|nr:MFS transporter [Terrimesophilobacter mesophilus]MBB5633277.1 EmrB/QacA subfamily drug resistance transporter [Terrimesophilobacter mesophilus]TFB80019.1 DHA2 family efflux MFS transporter permease subunit [Terrimesophilobacter mesophilus]